MLASAGRRAFLASCITAAALTAGVLPADAATAGWRVEAAVPAPARNVGVLLAVHADAAGDAWGAGAYAPTINGLGSPLVDRWNGHAWAQVTLPSAVTTKLGRGSLLLTVGSSSARNVWAFGLCGRSLTFSCWVRRAGTAWSAGKLSRKRFGAVVVDHVLVLGKRNVWAFGIKVTSGTAAFAMHFNGSGWAPMPPPGAVSVVDAAPVSASDIWAVEGPGLLSLGPVKGAVIHWSGGRWQTLAVPKALAAHGLNSVIALSDKDVWVGGSTANSQGGTTEAVGHWNGRRWTVTTMRIPASRAKYATFAMASDGHGGLWAAGDKVRVGGATRLWHFSGGRWARETIAGTSKPVLLLSLGSVPGTRSAWGVGLVGVGSARTGVIALDGAVPH